MVFRLRGTANPLLSSSGTLQSAEVYDSEIYGAMAGLEAVFFRGKDQECTAIKVMPDNSEAVSVLLTGQRSSSARRVEYFSNVVKRTAAPVKVTWVPGYAKIQGNELVDHLARGVVDTAETTKDTITDHSGHLALTRIRL